MADQVLIGFKQKMPLNAREASGSENTQNASCARACEATKIKVYEFLGTGGGLYTCTQEMRITTKTPWTGLKARPCYVHTRLFPGEKKPPPLQRLRRRWRRLFSRIPWLKEGRPYTASCCTDTFHNGVQKYADFLQVAKRVGRYTPSPGGRGRVGSRGRPIPYIQQHMLMVQGHSMWGRHTPHPSPCMSCAGLRLRLR